MSTGQPEFKSAVPDNLTQTEDWLANAPGGDVPLSEIFGPNPDAVQTQAQPTQQPAQAQQPAEPEVFLKGRKSVYKSPEEAIKGIDEKDELIDRLRQQYSQVTGRDPITGRFVRADQPQPPAQTPAVTPEAEIDYLNNPARYLQDLNEAVVKGDGWKFYETQAKFVQSMLKPYAAVVQDTARVAATDRVRERIKDFDEFARNELDQVLAENETLSTLVRTAESNPALYSHLPNLYETAYYVARGKRLPELLKQQAQPSVANTSPPRPTMRPGTLPPPTTPTGSKPFDPNNIDYGDPEQRKAYMKWLENKGVLDVKI